MMWEEANLSNVHRQAHTKSDVDSSARAQHHTIGEGPHQAASGKALADLIKQVFLLSHPVGSIFITEISTNPSTLYGGTWVAYGAGRVIVGLDAGQTEFDVVNETGGAKTHTLVESEIPAHLHGAGGLLANTTGSSHDHTAGTYQVSINRRAAAGTTGAVAMGSGVAQTDLVVQVTGTSGTTGSAHDHDVEGSTANTGGGGSHNNLQPYIVAYMWKRTA